MRSEFQWLLNWFFLCHDVQGDHFEHLTQWVITSWSKLSNGHRYSITFFKLGKCWIGNNNGTSLRTLFYFKVETLFSVLVHQAHSDFTLRSSIQDIIGSGSYLKSQTLFVPETEIGLRLKVTLYKTYVRLGN